MKKFVLLGVSALALATQSAMAAVAVPAPDLTAVETGIGTIIGILMAIAVGVASYGLYKRIMNK